MMFTFHSSRRLSENFQSTGRARLRRRPPARSLRPRVEGLENYQLLANFTVVLTTDSGGPNGQEVSTYQGDLRYCIEQADAAHSATSDTINFSPSVFGTPQTITLNRKTGPLVLDDSNPLSIHAPSGDLVTVSGGNAVEVLNITGGQVNISNLVISNGNATDGGGGILNAGVLKLTDCTIDQNQSADNGGGLINDGTATIAGCTVDDDMTTGTGSAGLGGGICNDGTLTVTSSIFNNDSAYFGGAIFNHAGDTATVNNSGINDDSATLPSSSKGGDGDSKIAPAQGGGVFVEGTVTLNNCNISSDSAGDSDSPGPGGGVEIYGGTANLNGCTVSNDSGVVASGQNRGIAAIGNYLGAVRLNACKIVDNADEGLATGGMVTAYDCTFSNDSTAGSGGAISNGPSSPSLTAALTVTDCTFSNDSAAGSGGAVDNEGTAAFTNCTFANNYAAGGGGAIWNQAGSSLTVTNCTIADNSAASSTGGGIWNQGALNLVNTIIAENTAHSGGDVENTGTVSTEHNLIGNGKDSGISTKDGNIVGKGKTELNPLLGSLEYNRGPTDPASTHIDTMALLPGSKAIGKADNALAPSTDERGVARTGKTDVGAYET